MLVVPPILLDLLGLSVGKAVNMIVEGERVVIESVKHPKYSLEDLLAQCDATAPSSEQDQQWLNAHPVGSELL